MNCSVCGNKILNGAKFCTACGAAVKKELFCAKCGYKLVSEEKFCPQCGTPTESGGMAFGTSGKQDGNKSKKQLDISEKFKSDVVIKVLQAVPKNIIDEQAAADIAKIISVHALGAAATGAAMGWIPGVGSFVARTAGVTAFIWTMYVRISGRLEIKLSKNKLKFLGSVILSDLTASVGSIAAVSAISLIPGIGSVSAALLAAGANYAMITAAGVLYLKLMSSLIGEGIDVSAMSDEELKARMKKVVDEQNVKKMMKEAQSEYIKARKAGTVSGKETVELEKE